MEALSLENLVRIESAGWDALCSSQGGAFYTELMTRDAVMILVDGSVLDRTTIAASLDGAPPWSSYELTDVRRLPLGADSAALLYRARATRDGQAAPFVAHMTSVYTAMDGRPRLALYQQTLLTS
ncbi:DUF4440 domain-containing protein [Leifsonia soli]|uniref:DUF4440 domain-containing protein n=1 Tax=Leifsonia soli TaxID=582665 RepID=A0A852SZ98_9MICO|nr:hypothetical protein [Leifsonia soli]